MSDPLTTTAQDGWAGDLVLQSGGPMLPDGAHVIRHNVMAMGDVEDGKFVITRIEQVLYLYARPKDAEDR